MCKETFRLADKIFTFMYVRCLEGKIVETNSRAGEKQDRHIKGKRLCVDGSGSTLLIFEKKPEHRLTSVIIFSVGFYINSFRTDTSENSNTYFTFV